MSKTVQSYNVYLSTRPDLLDQDSAQLNTEVENDGHKVHMGKTIHTYKMLVRKLQVRGY
jgi:hypothetical protein